MQKFFALIVLGLFKNSQATSTTDTSTQHVSDTLIQTLPRTADSQKLTVHMVHHTHDDVGWLKSVDEYFSGVYNNIQRVEIKLILDTTI